MSNIQTEKKTRADLTHEEIDALPENHPWKHADFFKFGTDVYAPSGDEEIEKLESEWRVMEEQRKQERLESHYTSKNSGVPERYWKESLDTFNADGNREIYEKKAAEHFAMSKGGRVLVMCGACGTGKTHLGCGIIRKRGGVYKTMLKLLYEIDSTMSFKAKETKIEILDRLVSAPMLVLDEIGRGIREDAQREICCYLISERYAALKPTVLISNLQKMELVKWLGVAVKDRLNETCTVVEFVGESYRLKKRKENVNEVQSA